MRSQINDDVDVIFVGRKFGRIEAESGEVRIETRFRLLQQTKLFIEKRNNETRKTYSQISRRTVCIEIAVLSCA